MSAKINKKKRVCLGSKVDIIPISDQAITDYFKIKNQKPIPTKVNKNLARVTAVTDLITAQRQLTEAEDELEDTRNAMQRWSKEARDDWKKLKERELQLRASFLRFNDFVRENHDKRQRAKMKIAKERNIQEHRKEQIAKMQEQLESLRQTENELNEKVESHQIYKDFLEQVVKESPEYHDIQDILSRYEVLSSTENKLNAQQAQTQTSIQMARENLTQVAGSQTQTMMNLQTELASLRVQQDNINTEVKKWESILSRTRAFAAEKAIEIQQVQNSSWDLYKTMCRLRKESISLAESDTEHQLEYITRRILDLSKIIRIAKQKAEHHKPESNAIVATSTLPSA